MLKSEGPGPVLGPLLEELYATFGKLLILSESHSKIIVIPTSQDVLLVLK